MNMDLGTWVLVIVFQTYGGEQITYQEFNSKGNCEIAQKTILSMKNHSLKKNRVC